jgi:hypothetical protein
LLIIGPELVHHAGPSTSRIFTRQDVAHSHSLRIRGGNEFCVDLMKINEPARGAGREHVEGSTETNFTRGFQLS